MKRVTTKQAVFDNELSELGKMRVLIADAESGPNPIFREKVVDMVSDMFDRTPWWKRSRPNRRCKK
jgi:hypothetical protein